MLVAVVDAWPADIYSFVPACTFALLLTHCLDNHFVWLPAVVTLAAWVSAALYGI